MTIPPNRDNPELARENPAQTPFQEHSEALFLTSGFFFRSAAEAAEKFAADKGEYVYSRFSNPTITVLNRRIALLEGAESALAVSSGMAAVLTTIMGLCESGDKIVCGANVFGSTVQLLSSHISRFGLSVEYVAGADPGDWQKAAKAAPGRKTALLLLETPSNPMQEVADLPALADIARQAGALLVVDNCFCAGAQQPLAWGADLVIHSATKYPDGQGRVLGGAIAGREELVQGKLHPFLRAAGPALSPFNAWIISKSLETLRLRTQACAQTAKSVAAWLEGQAPVRRVWHTALPSHPAHELAMRQQNNSGGGIITLAVRGDRAAAWRFIDALRRFSITANFGDVKSIVTHPATTTHRRLSAEERARIGLGDDIVRLSIGLESPDSLKEDLSRALAAV